MLGIALGVAALIVVLSVMNGFQKEVTDRMLSVLAHVEVFDNSGSMPDWRAEAAQAFKNPAVKGAAPFVETQGMLLRDDALRPAIVRGVLPEEEPNVSDVAGQTRMGSFKALQPGTFNIVLGIVIAYLTNYWIVGIPHDWQWMLGIEAVPALAFGLLLMTVPESPRWLLIRSRDAEARRVLERTTRENVEAEMAEIRASLAGAGDTGERLFRKKYFIPILLAFLISTFNQLTGINAILYYAPRLFEMSGVFREGAMMQSIMIGITNLTFTMLGMFLIDKVGRKKLIGVGAVGMFVSLVLVARGFWLERFEGYYMLVCLMGYIAFFAVSLGATIWVVISEVFPNSVRAKGQVLGSMTHWVWSALLSWFFPVFLSVGGTYIFGFFALIALGSLIFAIKLPETKDKSLEQIQKELVK